LDVIFKKMDPEKRDRIINSALEEFGRNGFDKASTNNIVKNAGISKGLLYHYFKSKKSLYDHLTDFVLKTTTETILEQLDWEKSDIFERIKEIGIIKMKLWSRYPAVMDFGKILYKGLNVSDVYKLAQKYSPDLMKQVYTKNIDYSLFREDIDIKKAIELIRWTVEKYGENWLEKTKDLKKFDDYNIMLKEIDGYLSILKKSFYKNV
jgi:TetR/AcrR family transcriptional regulator